MVKDAQLVAFTTWQVAIYESGRTAAMIDSTEMIRPSFRGGWAYSTYFKKQWSWTLDVRLVRS
jgi:hypothetical protein